MHHEEFCDHRWNSDKPIRLCLQCGQVRAFPTHGEAPRIIWQGRSDTKKPTELSSEDKRAIGVLVRSLGAKGCIRAEKKTGIPMSTLRSWVALSARGKKPKAAAAAEVKKAGAPPEIPYDQLSIPQKHQYLEAHKEDIIKDLQTVGLVETEGKWGFASSTVHSLIKRWRVKDVIYLRTPVRLQAPLPEFPDFSDSWNPPVQKAWLEAYAKIKASGRVRVLERHKERS